MLELLCIKAVAKAASNVVVDVGVSEIKHDSKKKCTKKKTKIVNGVSDKQCMYILCFE